MLRKRRLDFIALWASVLCASVLSAAPAEAAVSYVFTSDEGNFSFNSPSFFEGGTLPDSVLASHSVNIDEVYFGPSDIVLINSACESAENCFDAAFGLKGIFQTFGQYFASDGGAQITISQVSNGAPAPELSSWALLTVSFAGLAFARNRRIWRPRLRLSDPLPMRRFKGSRQA
jgi:hypothetical protein